MGIGGGALRLLTRLKRDGFLDDPLSVIEIGAQQLAESFFVAPEDIQTLGALFGVREPFSLGCASRAHGTDQNFSESAPLARPFWTWLGFDYAALDVDGSPGSIPLDLNCDSASADSWGKYRLVTNFGTTEHVVNQMNAFKVIHDLTAPGGVMLHELPMQGFLNHGLVNYNPKFFWMLCRSNDYRLLYMNVSQGRVVQSLPTNILDQVSEFEPDIRSRAENFKMADMGLIVAVQKVSDLPYVAPIDVPAGASAANKALRERYWTVFDRNLFNPR